MNNTHHGKLLKLVRRCLQINTQRLSEILEIPYYKACALQRQRIFSPIDFKYFSILIKEAQNKYNLGKLECKYCKTNEWIKCPFPQIWKLMEDNNGEI
jgi:hypothetical protein